MSTKCDICENTLTEGEILDQDTLQGLCYACHNDMWSVEDLDERDRLLEDMPYYDDESLE